MLSSARAAAFDILLRVERDRAYATELLHSDRLRDLPGADRGLCMQLVMGVLRWRSRLDLALGALSSEPLPKLDLEVLIALRLAAYQIGFLERIPARAAVNESVELVKRARKRSAASLVNAVLRRLAARRDLLEPVLPPGPKTVFDFEQMYSHPLWLVERWAAQFGMADAERICAYDQAVPQTAIRLRHPAAERELVELGLQLAPGRFLRSARRVLAGDVTRTSAFAEGRVVVQDEGSQLIGELVGHGERLLDCCAAPGGKAAILAERNPGATIIAAELHPHRAQTMRKLLAGSRVNIVAARAEALPFDIHFDRVLADVPCSGTGTLARNPEIKWRLVASDLADLHRRQVAILSSALERLRPGGRLVYSSCSLEPEENEDVVNEVLENRDHLRVCYARLELERLRREGELEWNDLDSLLDGPFLRLLPGVHPCDGFFAAIIERTADSSDTSTQQPTTSKRAPRER